MEYDELLRRLRSYSPAKFRFVSQYVDAHWTEEFHKKRTVLFFKNEWNAALERLHSEDAPNDVIRSLQEDRARIEEHLIDAMRGTVDSRYQGLAFFAASGSGFFEVFRSNVRFDDQLAVDDKPHFRQLARLADEYEALMLIMIDSSRARVYELKLAGVDEYLSMADEVPGRHKAGGWSQMRFQRHIRDHRDRHHKDVARAVEKLFDGENMKNVVIAGQEAVITQFKRFLPKRVVDKVFATIHLDMIEPEDAVIRTVLDHLQKHERIKENRGVSQAITQASIGGKGAVGLSATLQAVNERLVQTLYISEKFAREGARCVDCRLLSVDHDRCPYCGGEPATVDLAEAMVNDVVEAGGDVDTVKENEELDSFEGIAATTRFEKVAT